MRNSRKFFLFFVVITTALLLYSPGHDSSRVSCDSQVYADFSSDNSYECLPPVGSVIPQDFSIEPQAEVGGIRRKCVMTVFIHGTVGPRMSFTALGRWLKNMIQGKRRGCSTYQEYIEESKKVSFQRLQPINDLGLVRIDLDEDLTKKNMGYFGKHTSLLYDQIRRSVDSDCEDSYVFYTFSWTGRLSHKHRVTAAGDLYDLLLEEKNRLSEELGMPVELHVLAHSHGCNTVLCMDLWEKKRQKGLLIDKAVFFGGPVQRETEKFICSDIFKKIYHIFSLGDHIQKLDFVSTKDVFSRRMFGTDENHPIDLPDNVIQINVTLGSHHPFHYELWLWGRKSFPHFCYRKKLPIHPLPLSVFTPAIIELADSVDWGSMVGKGCDLHFDADSSTFVMQDGDEKLACKVDLVVLKEEALKIL